MNPAPLLAAALCAVLAGSASAAVADGGVKDGGAKDGGKPGEAPKYDFTVRPELRPVAIRSDFDPKKPLTYAEAKALSDSLFSAYLNLSAVSLFRFHVRTEKEPPMPEEDFVWAEKKLAEALDAGNKLVPQGEAALKAGIERKVLPPGSTHFGRVGAFIARAKLRLLDKPSMDHLRIAESGALAGVLCDLSKLISSAAEPKEYNDPADIAKIEKMLVEDQAELTDIRKKIAAFIQKEDEEAQLRESQVLESRERVKQATKRMGGFGEGEGSPKDDKTPNTEPGAGTLAPPTDGQNTNPPLTAEEAALRASSVDRAPRKSLKSRTVPNP